MKAVTEQRRTGFAVVTAAGELYADEAGHIWFSRQVAAGICRDGQGAFYEAGSLSTVKTVVTGYEK
jgi:hypothetical protein